MSAKKYKIAIFIDLLIAGGVQKTAIEEVRNLRKMGYDTRLIILMHTQNESRDLLGKIPFEFLSDRFPRFLKINLKFPVFNFLSSQHLLSPFIAPFYIKKGDFDLIISHGTTTTFTALSLFYFKKIPYLTIIYDPMNYILEKVYKGTPLAYVSPLPKHLLSFLESKIVKNAASSFVISNVHKEYLKKHYHILPEVLYLGINPTKKIPEAEGDKILFLGRWDKEKNIELIFDLCQKLPRSQFVVAGRWTKQTDFKNFKEEIEKRQVGKQIELIPKYKEADLFEIFQKSSFWAHPNFEAFSLSALEAASFGLSIIIPKNSGISELFENKKHGFFPNINDKKGFLEAVEYLANNPQKARQMGQDAAKIAKKYTWQKHTQILSREIKKFKRGWKKPRLS